MAKKAKPSITSSVTESGSDPASRSHRPRVIQILLVPGFTCPDYSTVPRIVAVSSDGRIFDRKVGDGMSWVDISIGSAAV